MTDLAQITVCIVQMATVDLCRLGHVLHLCATKYKASVCLLRAANWHFADCGLSVSHRQILAGAFTPQRLLMMSARRRVDQCETLGKYLHTVAQMGSHRMNLAHWEAATDVTSNANIRNV